MLLHLTIETIETDGKYFSFSIVNIYTCNPHMHKMGLRESKHYIFGDHFYLKNAESSGSMYSPILMLENI